MTTLHEPLAFPRAPYLPITLSKSICMAFHQRDIEVENEQLTIVWMRWAIVRIVESENSSRMVFETVDKSANELEIEWEAPSAHPSRLQCHQ